MSALPLSSAPEVCGWLASALTLLTFLCSDMRRLRCLALGANLAFIGYGNLNQLWPVLALHSLLVPVNAWRLCGTFRPQSQPKAAERRLPAVRGRDRRRHHWVSYSLSGTQLQNRLRSPQTLSTRPTGAQYFWRRRLGSGKAATSRG